jgi:hypothetical protein
MLDLLTTELAGLGERFATNELAYLALTSKPEHAVRDRLAFALHEKLAPDTLVAREWFRTDLAILRRPAEPVLLVELKSIYSFDAATARYDISTWTSRMEDDEAKARCLGPGASVCTILLATHPGGDLSPADFAAVKYGSGVTRAALERGGHAGVKEGALSNLSGRFGSREVRTGEIQGGTAFGVPVSVLYWLVIAPAVGVEKPSA